MITLDGKPTPNIALSFKVGNPYYGAALPRVANQTEVFEAASVLGPLTIGGGVMIHHYRDDFNFNEKKSMSDAKIGATFSFRTDESLTEVWLYPRLLPMTMKSSPGKSFDTDYYEIRYHYYLDKIFSYYSRISMRGFYFFDNDAAISNYYGVSDIIIGFELGNKELLGGKDISFVVEVGKTLIL